MRIKTNTWILSLRSYYQVKLKNSADIQVESWFGFIIFKMNAAYLG